MKKMILLFSALIFSAGLVFADTTRFYKDEKIIDTMYVDASDGLRVRDKPSLKSNRLCGLPHRLPVKVVSIGDEETIDGITAPWVEILVPPSLNKGASKFGWIFGGYLKAQRPEFLQEDLNTDGIKNYLKNQMWSYAWEDGGSIYTGVCFFGENQIDIYCDHGVSVDHKTSGYSFDGHYFNLLEFFNKITDYDYNGYYNQYAKMEMLFTENYFTDKNTRGQPDNLIFRAELPYAPKNYCYGKWVENEEIYEILRNNIEENLRIYSFKDGKNVLQWLQEKNIYDSRLINNAIKMGVSAEGTKYEKEYHQYWDPIMDKLEK